MKHTDAPNNVTVLTMSQDRLDLQSSPEFKEKVTELLGAGKNIVIDLHSVQFIDSTGLGALLSAQRKIKEVNGNMLIANASEQALAMLRLVKMNRILDIYPSLEDAVYAANA